MTDSMQLMKQGQETTKNAIAEMRSVNLDSRVPQNVAMGGLALGGILVVGAIGTTIITGVAALATAGTFAVGGWYGFNKIKANAPAIRKDFQMKAMAKLIEDTKENDIYHLQNSVLERSERARKAQEGVAKLRGLVLSLESKRNKAEGKEKLIKMLDERIATFSNLHEKVSKAYTTTLQANKDFEGQVEEAREMRKVSDMIGDVVQFLDLDNGKTIDDILNTEAFDSIDESYNENLAMIETSLAGIDF